jgi:hypothetical protein|tara:strand:- start:686 stop:1291 length:606 start_codon:yes stop_codon:yes gene_type:complete
MKQLLTEHIPFQVDKLLVEQSIKANKPLRVSGIIQRAGVENHNGRIYEQDILEREIQKYKDGPVKEKRALGELDHPDSAVINLNNVSHNIVEVTMRGGDVHGVIEILTTPAGNILKELFRCGVTVGISSRGMGSVEENSNGVLMVQEDFDLLCFDMVSTPSTPGAYVSPMNEGVSTPTTKYTHVHNIIRDIICDNTGVCKC